jgi:hypothetical protein
MDWITELDAILSQVEGARQDYYTAKDALQRCHDRLASLEKTALRLKLKAAEEEKAQLTALRDRLDNPGVSITLG